MSPGYSKQQVAQVFQYLCLSHEKDSALLEKCETEPECRNPNLISSLKAAYHSLRSVYHTVSRDTAPENLPVGWQVFGKLLDEEEGRVWKLAHEAPEHH